MQKVINNRLLEALRGLVNTTRGDVPLRRRCG
jgi:hypothetical protein